MGYQQHDQTSCFFGSLASSLKAPNQLAAANAITTRIYSSLMGEILVRWMFSDAIMTDQKRRKWDQNLRYKLEHWKKIDTFDIMNNISKYVTLVQLMY